MQSGLARFSVNLLTTRSVTEVQTRGVMTDWRMLRDYKRRQLTKQYYFERNQYNVIRKNNIIPEVLKKAAHEDLLKLPRDSNRMRIHQRCVITSFPRSVDLRYRLGRHAWRHLADYNYLSGVQKAMW